LRFVENVCFARKGGAMRRLTGLLVRSQHYLMAFGKKAGAKAK
jgi:hypothetical protein